MADDDDWDAPSSNAQTNQSFGVRGDGGTKFSAGRGFKPGDSNKGSSNTAGGWGDEKSSSGGYNKASNGNNADDAWNSGGGGGGGDAWGAQDNSGGDGGDQPRRFGGRGGGRGGRGGGGGGGGAYGRYRNNDEDGGGGDGESGGGYDGERRGRGGGRGGRGGRGGGRGGFRNRDDGENGGGGGGGDAWGGDGGAGGGGGGEDGEPEKKTEHYIPVEVEDVNDLFNGITIGDNFKKMREVEVKMTGNDLPQPIQSFASSGLRAHLLENISKSKYTDPTPIQQYSIPVILAKRDLMGCAQTGSGKTAAFLLPILHDLLSNKAPPSTEGGSAQPNVVIVSPTRELAIQIHEQARKFAYNSTIAVAVAYGGTSTNHQRGKLLAGCHILVATPGRLKDFLNKAVLNFGALQYFVLDEADRMLDMGFMPEVEHMMSHPSMPAVGERVTLMFSATFPEEVQELAKRFLHNYIFLVVGIVGSASTDVTQEIHQVSKFEKRNKLLEILKEAPNERTLVFVETKRSADFLATFLSEKDIQTTSIHGDRLQSERESALRDFKSGYRKCMVATGVAARGLDIKDVQHVINFDLPSSIDEYVHRIGRTGRVGNRGRATSFFDDQHDTSLAANLATILQQAGQQVPDWLGNSGYGGKADQFGGRDIRGDDFGQARDVTTSAPVEEEW